MKGSVYWFQKSIAGCLVILLTAPVGEAATTFRQQTPATQSTGAGNSVGGPQTSRSAGAANPNTPVSQSSETPPAQTGNQSAYSSSQSTTQQQNNTQPLGTAAAPDVKTTGVAASRPAGAVIAPAKQKRSRSLLIRVGLIVGAAVAVGTVVGLSEASPSHPR